MLVGDDGRADLVETGLNESSAKKALRAVREKLGLEVAAVLTTHAHADHFGSNATIVARSGAEVHAPAFDEAFLRCPVEDAPSFLSITTDGVCLSQPSPPGRAGGA